MAIIKPLLPEEVPEEYRNRISWERGTWQQQVVYPGRIKNRSMVWIRCQFCGRENDIAVNDVRNFIRGTRAVFPGDHRGCKYPGRHINGEGYHFLWMPDHPNAMGDRYVAEHIYVMSEHLGRPIDTKSESVHHIDGDKSNNNISNLQLRTRYHGKGQVRYCGDCNSTNILTKEL